MSKELAKQENKGTKELVRTKSEIFKDESQDPKLRESAFHDALNVSPPDNWAKNHPTAEIEVVSNGNKIRVPVKFLPIERIEWLLTTLFLKWKTEIKSCTLVGNSMMCIVRLHYRDPITQEWEWQDGVGAAPLRTQRGAGAIEFDKLKSASVQTAAPAAESFAIKDAAHKIGRIFGSDMNRSDDIAMTDLTKQHAETAFNELAEKERSEMKDKIDSFKDEDALVEWAMNSEYEGQKDFDVMIKERIKEINSNS